MTNYLAFESVLVLEVLDLVAVPGLSLRLGDGSYPAVSL